MDTTTAVIQFIGIVLFSAQVPNDPGIHAILPRIGHVHNLPGAKQRVVVPADQVEDHVAVILYRKEDRLYPSGGWCPDGFLKSGWEYVRLDGERVQFLTGGKNGEPAIPSLLPRAGQECPANAGPPRLRPAYEAPYQGAIGVIDIPAGRLDACEGSSSRIDTRLFIRTAGTLVIAARKPGEPAKTISLDEDAVVYVANVPPKFLLEDPDALPGGGLPHWDAYNKMLDASCSGRPEPVKPAGVQACDLGALTEAYKTARNKPPSRTMPNMVDSECSNTQWP